VHPLDAAIASALDGVPGIGTAVLFGSRAGTAPRGDSDLDVGLVPAAACPLARRDLVAQVAVRLAHLAPGGRVDVVLIDAAPVALRQEIMRSGRVLWSNEPDRWRELRVATMREHGDGEAARAEFVREQRRRLIGGGPHGRSARALESLERTRGLRR
jgi:predicted nucleotidyltransferase